MITETELPTRRGQYREVEAMMWRWRRWNHVGNGIPKGYQCLMGKYIQPVRDGGDTYAPLSDDEAERVHIALDDLRELQPLVHEAVMLRYLVGISDMKKAARAMRKGETTYRELLNEGHSFLQCVLKYL